MTELPETADRSNWRTPPFSRWAFHHIRDVLPVAEIARGAAPVMTLEPAPRSFEDFRLSWHGATQTLDEALAATATDGIVILKDGRLIYEAYFNGLDAQTPHILMSATKAVTGLMAGLLHRAGKLDIEAEVTRYVPEVVDTAYARATIRQLIDMRTGVRLDAAESAAYTASTLWDPPPEGAEAGDLRGFLSTLKAPHQPHGGPFAYISSNTDLVGWAMERAGGAPYAQLVSDLLWQPMGAETDAFITTDGHGSARSAGGLNATTRDFARIGQAMLDAGESGSVLPKAWIDDLTERGDHQAWADGEWGKVFTPVSPNMRHRAGWYILDDAPRMMFAMGIHGQNLFVDRANGIVIAKVSSQPGPFDYMTVLQTHALARAIQAWLL